MFRTHGAAAPTWSLSSAGHDRAGDRGDRPDGVGDPEHPRAADADPGAAEGCERRRDREQRRQRQTARPQQDVQRRRGRRRDRDHAQRSQHGRRDRADADARGARADPCEQDRRAQEQRRADRQADPDRGLAGAVGAQVERHQQVDRVRDVAGQGHEREARHREMVAAEPRGRLQQRRRGPFGVRHVAQADQQHEQHHGRDAADEERRAGLEPRREQPAERRSDHRRQARHHHRAGQDPDAQPVRQHLLQVGEPGRPDRAEAETLQRPRREQRQEPRRERLSDRADRHDQAGDRRHAQRADAVGELAGRQRHHQDGDRERRQQHAHLGRRQTELVGVDGAEREQRRPQDVADDQQAVDGDEGAVHLRRMRSRELGVLHDRPDRRRKHGSRP